MLSHASPDISWAQCTCLQCRVRRVELRLSGGCPCKECQPGEGIDFGRSHGAKTRARNAELAVLLAKPSLTPEEEVRLDELCHSYLFG